MSEELAKYETKGIDAGVLARKKIYAGVPDDDVQLALAICNKYGLDPLLRHVVLVKGRGKDEKGNWTDRYSVYITRDGLLDWAHRTNIPWAITFGEAEPKINPYTGQDDIYLTGTLQRTGYPPYGPIGLWFSEYVGTDKDGKSIGAWATHPAAMHQKVVEVYLLRRGFNVGLTPIEEMERVISGEVVEAEVKVEDKPKAEPQGAKATAATPKDWRGLPEKHPERVLYTEGLALGATELEIAQHLADAKADAKLALANLQKLYVG